MAVQNNTMTEEERARLARQGVTGLPRVLTGARDALVGTLARPGTAIQDTLRVGATQLLGGDPNTLAGGPNQYNQNAQQLVERGLGGIATGVSEIVAPIQQAGLAALGAQPAAQQPAPITQAAAPVVSPTTPATAPAGRAPRTAAELEGLNAGLASTLASTQAPAPTTATRGDYNTANTSVVDAAGGVRSTIGQNSRNPVSFVGGAEGFGGFGQGGARAYLDRMAVQDAQEQARIDQQRRAAQEGVERIGLNNAATSGSVQESMVARRQLAALDQAGLQRIQDQGATARQATQGQTQLQQANIAGQFGLQQEAMRGAAGLQQAEIAGEYGLAGREAAALASLAVAQAKGQSGAELKAQVEAMRLARQQAIADEAEQAGDFATRDRALGISQPAASRLTQDALGNVVAVDGRPVTAEEAQAYLQALGYYKTPAQ